jgi:hypothetical protein
MANEHPQHRQLSEGARGQVRCLLEALGAGFDRLALDGAVAYYVASGELKGWWVAPAGAGDPDDWALGAMLDRLDEAWRLHLKAYAAVARAMRSVGR